MSRIKTYSLSKDGNTPLSANFKVKEFACKDGSDTIKIDLDLVDILQKIRNHFNKPVTVTSAYRTAAYNAKVGGASQSTHLTGCGADISVAGTSIQAVAKYAESINVLGIGLYTVSVHVHVDTRTAKCYWINNGGGNEKASTFGGSSGSTGSAARVLEVQKGLNTRYSMGLIEDGIMDPRTAQALIKALQTELNKQFQKGLAVDGIWGPKTEAAVVTVKKNSQGNLTFILQSALEIHGYDPGSLDGIFGDKTYAAVQRFQKAKGLTVDGQAGIKTFAALFSSLV